VSEPSPTAEQRAAIDARDRDVFCEAGAGTGKTRVLVDRYCDAVERDEVGIDAILAFTFTERAAAELRTRVRRELRERGAAARERGEHELSARLRRAARETERAWVMTIHGFCRRLLATHPAAAGIDPRFRVLDEAEASRLRRRARDDAAAEVAASDPGSIDVIAAYRPSRFGDMAVLAHERLRSQGMPKPHLPAITEPVRSSKQAGADAAAMSPSEHQTALAARRSLDLVLAAFGRQYEELKTARSGLDFADLELRALELLRESAAVGAAWRGRFAHVMVDEFQDTNRVQLDLVEALRGPQTHVFRVGDELQSIYRFRNADLAVFREQRDLARGDPGTEVSPLTGSFRSRPEVIAAVNALGEAVLGADAFAPLAAAREPVGDGAAPRVELLLTLDEGTGKDKRGWHEFERELEPPPSESQAKLVAEARVLASRLRELVDAGEATPAGIVVLLRAFTHVDAYEEALDRAGLAPYVVGGRGYWSQQQVEDLLRLLEVVANPLDDEMLLGALAGPANAVSPDALWLLRRATTVEGENGERRHTPHLWPLIEWRFGGSERRPEPLDESWLEQIPADDVSRLERFCSTLAELRAAAPVLALEELLERTMTAFAYDLHLLARRRGRGRMANVRKLMRLAREFEQHEHRDLRGFLTAAHELTERDEREGIAATQAEDHDGVRIMTVHAAKGLEFEVVAVPDLGRPLAGGERGGDIVIGRLALGDDGAPEARYGLRLALPAARSFGVWELNELHREALAEAAEEGARLVHVAATRAQERLILSGVFKPSDRDAAERDPRQSAIRRLLPALAARGWDPVAAAAEIELEPPTPAAGARALARPARLGVRVEIPGAARASELARRPADVSSDRANGAVAARPPLARPETTLPVGHLSYSALAEYERCGYRFYVERMLGLVEPPGPLHPLAGTEASDQAGDQAATPAVDVRSRSLGFGNAVHAALEWSARQRWSRPDDERLAALLAREGLADGGDLERARAMVDGWLASPLVAELAEADARAEVPFALRLGEAIVRGQIDLLVRGAAAPASGQLDLLGDAEPVSGGPTTVIDFKTDSLGESGPAALRERYAAQRQLYALAIASANRNGSEPERVRAIHVFLEAPAEPVIDTFDAAGLAAARAQLEALIAEIRGGGNGFRPTEEPSHAVCLGCPAAERLCPHPKWKPGWR
jgi:ATP-dependent helicase/nuclease subunit A